MNFWLRRYPVIEMLLLIWSGFRKVEHISIVPVMWLL